MTTVTKRAKKHEHHWRVGHNPLGRFCCTCPCGALTDRAIWRDFWLLEEMPSLKGLCKTG